MNWYKNSKFCLIFKGSCLKEKRNFCSCKWNIVFSVYELGAWSWNLNSDFTLSDCWFGGVKLAWNADPDKYESIGYGIGFNSRSEFSLSNGSMGKNVNIFGIDMSSSVQIDNKKKDILFLGKRSTQGLNNTMLTAVAQYLINFSRPQRKFV